MQAQLNKPHTLSVKASEFKTRFGKYRELALSGELIGVNSHGRDDDVFLISKKELNRLRAERSFFHASDMPDEWADALKNIK